MANAAENSRPFPTISLVLPALHLSLCFATKFGLIASEGSWGWFLIFLVDFPFSIALLPFSKFVDPLLVFGTFGTLWWYFISRVLIYLVRRVTGFRRKPSASPSS